MEIIDYLRLLRVRLGVLIGLPLLSVAGVAVGVFVVEPQSFAATATIATPALVGGATFHQYSGANATKAFVYNFTSTATSDVILREVSDETHLSKKAIHNGLSTGESGQQSSFIQLTYTTSDRSLAAPVVKAVAADTLRYLFQTQLELARAPVTRAQAALTSVDAAIAAVQKQTGDAQPDQALTVLQSELASDEDVEAVQGAEGNASTATGLGPTVAALKQEIANLTPEVDTYRTLLKEQNQASDTLRQDQTALQQAESQVGAANPASDVVVGATRRATRATVFAKEAAVALGGSLVLSLLILGTHEFFTGGGGKHQARRNNRPIGGHVGPLHREPRVDVSV